MNETRLERAFARRGHSHSDATALGASAFCATWQVMAGSRRLFVKTLPAARAEMLEAEADGLRALAATDTVRVPQVLDLWCDAEEDLAVLALEWLDLASADAGFGARFGRALGALHQHVPTPAVGRFGWHRDNFLGATPQRNPWSAAAGRDDWIAFFGRERLHALRERLTARPGTAALCRAVDEVVRTLPRFFEDGYQPRPSLIHGDLWCGNWGMLADGTPVVYDPAVAWADAEAELAMMELFGAPPPGFWPAYEAVTGRGRGEPGRRGLYQLYHLLNHALLFGGGYLPQALELARRLLRA